MTSPSGLCLDGSLLFVCDGPGVKVFNAAAPANLQLLSELNVSNSSDVIAANNLLIVVTTSGLYQYDYTDPTHITPLSYLPVNTVAP
jgi:predicted alternative tryptophan synthase beta-subunit